MNASHHLMRVGFLAAILTTASCAQSSFGELEDMSDEAPDSGGPPGNNTSGSTDLGAPDLAVMMDMTREDMEPADQGAPDMGAREMCVPETNEEYCERINLECGGSLTPDNCGELRMGLVCGGCDADESCMDGVCVCGDAVCPVGAECGAAENACGAMAECGTCAPTETCDATNTCVCNAETEAEFCARIETCGNVTAADGCGVMRTALCGCGETRSVPTTVGIEDYFGIEVDVLGTRALVGGTQRGGGVARGGKAWVLERAGGVWSATTVFQSPSTRVDGFGSDLALGPGWALVGDPSEDRNSDDADRGAAYVWRFNAGSWSATPETIRPAVANEDSAFAKCIAKDGTSVIFGSAETTMFRYATTSNPWVKQADFTPTSVTREEGFSNTCHAAGLYAVVGQSDWTLRMTFPTPSVRSIGRVAVFDRGPSTNFTERAFIAPDIDQGGARFGTSAVVTEDGLVIVGAPGYDQGGVQDRGAVFVFARSGSAWTRVQRVDGPHNGPGLFGQELAIGGEGTPASPYRILVGATGDPGTSNRADAGAVYAYSLDASNRLVLESTIYPPSPQNGAKFGSAIAIDGNTFIVGAPFEDSPSIDGGAVYFYDWRMLP